jgi:NAD(P)-dependent dehydrogenase (short-subunit alcohol dehydrogenase family)
MSASAERPLEGRVVALTGASSGIGRQLADALVRAGASVLLGARRLDRIEELAGTLERTRAVALDVTSEESRAGFVAAAVDTFGRLDGLVNNAGVSNVKPALRETTEEFERVVQTNLVGAFSLARLAADRMKDAGGSIVNVASIAGYRATDRLPAAGYTASKAGLVGLTRELGAQWARYRIRVNALAPGFFETEMTEGLFDDAGNEPDWLNLSIPMRRTGAPGELDAALVFLLGDGSAYVTGQTIVVDGGLTAR